MAYVASTTLDGLSAEAQMSVVREFRNLQDSMGQDSRAWVRAVLHAPPSKFSEGTTVIADGVDWNPGSGPGQYSYVGGVWVK